MTPPTTPLHPNPVWPTPSGINETEARRICQAPILMSPLFNLCQNYTVQSLEVISKSCMLDLQVRKQSDCLYCAIQILVAKLTNYSSYKTLSRPVISTSKFIHSLLCVVQLTDAGDLVATTVLSEFVESCIWNIVQTDVQTVEQTIQSFNITVEIVTIYSVEITAILQQVLAISCPGQPECSSHGRCVAGVCMCDSGQHFILILSRN